MDCPNCGFPLEYGVRQSIKDLGLKSAKLHSCPRCGYKLDPPVEVSVEEGEGSRSYGKLLD